MLQHPTGVSVLCCIRLWYHKPGVSRVAQPTWKKYTCFANSGSLTDRIPAVMSECPPMNFVPDVMLMSAPSASGCWNTGAKMLLSTTTIAPAYSAM